MKPKRYRVRAAVVAIAAAATVWPILNAPAALAAGTLAGAAGVSPTSGISSTSFQLSLPAGASCPGDSPNAGYRWQTYMVPVSVDPSTLTFDANGPTPQGIGASFRQPLYDTASSPIVDRQTAAATTAGGPGPIINIPAASYAVFAPGNIPAGAYNVGIACTLGPASATQMKTFWNLQKTFTANATGGPAQVSWVKGAVPAAPTLVSVVPGDGRLTANYTATASDPPTTSFTVAAVPQGGGTTVTATSASATSQTLTGLVNGTTYNVTVKATNSTGDSAPSNTVAGTPNITRQPVQNLTASPGTNQVTLNWNAPADAATHPPTGYTVTNSPTGGTTTITGTSAVVSNLTPGTVYTFTVTPTYASAPAGQSATVQAAPLSAQVLEQQVTVTRPVGQLVFTQVCGLNGALPAEAEGPFGFPALAAANAVTTGGTAPTHNGAPDPKFPDYPYPTNAAGEPAPNYPTKCTVDLGKAKLVTRGPHAGKFFAASGVLNQVTVVDTRDQDVGWSANGKMSQFSAGAGKTFAAGQLGWTPVRTSDSAPFTDASGKTYDQDVTAGAAVPPNTSDANNGLGAGRTLASAAASKGLGVAVLDARLRVLIPVTAASGVYTGTLTVSALA